MTAALASRLRPPWCGRCDERTRLTELDDATAARCPSCHPLRGIWPVPRTVEEADAANSRVWEAAYGSPPPAMPARHAEGPQS